VRPFLADVPQDFKRQVLTAYGAPDLILARATTETLSASQRKIMANSLAALSHSEMMATFLRWIYAVELQKLDVPGRIFRDNSMPMVGTGVLLRSHDDSMVEDLTDVVVKRPNLTPAELLMKWIPIMKGMSQFNRIVYRNAFVAARRRFPDGIVTLAGLSGILFLRHIMAEVNVNEVSIAPMQQVMNIAVFKPGMNQATTAKDVLMAMADFLMGLTVLKTNWVPKDGLDFDKLIEVMCDSLPQIMAKLNVQRTLKDHPVVFSIQELIETCFTGPNEDPRVPLHVAGEDGLVA
jgi:hypothetical protein